MNYRYPVCIRGGLRTRTLELLCFVCKTMVCCTPDSDFTCFVCTEGVLRTPDTDTWINLRQIAERSANLGVPGGLKPVCSGRRHQHACCEHPRDLRLSAEGCIARWQRAPGGEPSRVELPGPAAAGGPPGFAGRRCFGGGIGARPYMRVDDEPAGYAGKASGGS